MNFTDFIKRYDFKIVLSALCSYHAYNAIALYLDPPIVTGVTNWLYHHGMTTDRMIAAWSAGAFFQFIGLFFSKKRWWILIPTSAPALGYFAATFNWALEFSAWQPFGLVMLLTFFVVFFAARFSVEGE